MPSIITCSSLIIVEGDDDENFIRALAIHLNCDRNLQIIKAGGKNNIRPTIKAASKTPGFENVAFFGVIRDADDSFASTLQSTQDALIASGLPAPKDALEIEGTKPKVKMLFYQVTAKTAPWKTFAWNQFPVIRQLIAWMNILNAWKTLCKSCQIVYQRQSAKFS